MANPVGRGPTWAWISVGAIGLVGTLGAALWHGMDGRVTDHETRIRVLENNQQALDRIEQKLDRVLHDSTP